MLKKTITFKGFDGKEYTEDFYFHLSKADLVMMNIKVTGGLEFYIDRLTRESDNAKILEIFEEIIEKSYGVKIPGDKSFEKTPQALLAFKSTDAYSELIMELFQNPQAAIDFIRGLMPDDVQAAAAEASAVPGFRPGFDPSQRPGQFSAQPEETTPQHTQQVQPDPQTTPIPPAPVPPSEPQTTSVFPQQPTPPAYPGQQ